MKVCVNAAANHLANHAALVIMNCLLCCRYRDQRDRPDLSNPESMQLYLETRFEQLKVSNLFVASALCCMQGSPCVGQSELCMCMAVFATSSQGQSNQAHAQVLLDSICGSWR